MVQINEIIFAYIFTRPSYFLCSEKIKIRLKSNKAVYYKTRNIDYFKCHLYPI